MSSTAAMCVLPIVWALASCGQRPAPAGIPTSKLAPDAAPLDSGTDAAEAGLDAAPDAAPPTFESLLDDQPPFGNDERRAVCGRRADCRISRSIDVGVDAQGRSIQLVTAALFPRSKEDVGYYLWEHWALLRSGGGLVGRQLLFRDGTNANVGEGRPLDSDAAEANALVGLTVGGGEVSYRFQWTPTAGAWSGTTAETIGLTDLRLLRYSSFSKRYDVPGGQEDRFDYDKLVGRSTLKEPAEIASYAIVPKLEVDSAFLSSWKTTAIKDCAAPIDGQTSGYVLTGAASPKDTTFYVLAVGDDQLFVEVHDDHVVTGKKGGDALDIWVVADFRAHGYWTGKPVKPTQFRAQLHDGAVSRVSGPVVAPPVVEVSGGTPPRLRIELPKEDVLMWSLAYRDTDDGASVERVIATSRLKHIETHELAIAHSVDPLDARCRLVSGALALERPPRVPLRSVANHLRSSLFF